MRYLYLENPKEYEQVKKHVTTSTHVGAWAWEWSDGENDKQLNKKGLHTFNWICHAKAGPIMEEFPRELKFFASCGAFSTQTFAKDYLDWVFSERSPWAKIHKMDFEPFRDEKTGLILGFVLGPDVINNCKSRTPIYNLLVAARFMRDYPRGVHEFNNLRELGLSELSAFLLARVVVKDTKTKNFIISGAWYGSHEPIKENTYSMYTPVSGPLREKETKFACIDLKAFSGGDFRTKWDEYLSGERATTLSYDYNLHGQPQGPVNNKIPYNWNTEIWMKEFKKSDLLIDDIKGSEETVNTKFSTTKSISKEAIIEFGKKIDEYVV